MEITRTKHGFLLTQQRLVDSIYDKAKAYIEKYNLYFTEHPWTQYCTVQYCVHGCSDQVQSAEESHRSMGANRLPVKGGRVPFG